MSDFVSHFRLKRGATLRHVACSEEAGARRSLMEKLGVTAVALLALSCVAPLANAQERPLPRQLSAAQERFASALEGVFGERSRARRTRWRRQGQVVAVGFQVRFRGAQVQRLHFSNPELAEAYRADLPQGHFAEVHGGDVLHAFGPGLAGVDPERLRAIPWRDRAAQRVGQGFRQLTGARQALGQFLLGERPTQAAGGGVSLREVLDSAQASEALSPYLQERARVALEALAPEEQGRFGELLDSLAGSPLHQAYLAKALAAGNTLDDLEWFRGAIQGQDEDWLRANATLIGEAPLVQSFTDSCVPTVAQALQGELDPVYALRHRLAGSVSEVDEEDPERVNARVSGEQRRMLEGQGGVAVPRAQKGGRGVPSNKGYEWLADGAGDDAGIDYQLQDTRGDPEAALEVLDRNLTWGIPTPTGVGSQRAGHALLAVERRGEGEDAEYLIYDPWLGGLQWVDRATIRSGRVAGDNPNFTGEIDVVGAYQELEPGGPR
jgi:hypothetical protein